MSLKIVDGSNLPQVGAGGDKLNHILNLVFVTLGAIALLMLVIAGLRYAVSAGDKDKMANSRRMIIYTVIGLIVIIFAATIVNVVIGRL